MPYDQGSFADGRPRLKPFSLPNGMVGRPYSEEFDISTYAIEPIADFRIEGLNRIGLEYDATQGRIEGTPSVEGTHKIAISFRYVADDEADDFLLQEVGLLINPDPKSLWKSLDSDSSDPYWKPDETCEVRREGDRHIVIASKRGRSHAHEGKFRDDDFDALCTGRDGWSILAVADGAGSARFSRKGSELACRAATQSLIQYLPGVPDSVLEALLKQQAQGDIEDSKRALSDLLYNSLGRAAFAAYKKIQEEASFQSAPMRDYSTTLLLAVHKRLRTGHFFGSFGVGDGAIGLFRKDHSVQLLAEPDGGQFAGQTRFLNMSEIFEYSELAKRLRYTVVEDFTALMLMTDGVSDPKFQTDNNLLRLENWSALWQDVCGHVNLDRGNERAGSELLQWLDFWSPGNHDDRTLAILY